MIFEIFAPVYWAAGLPVIPLHPPHADVASAGKRPIPERWQQYAKELPDQSAQKDWLLRYPEANMGLVLGPQSQIMVVDLDTDDTEIRDAVLAVLPPSPWERRGAKGAVYAYRYNGTQTFRIKNSDNKTLVEVLSAGTQVVLPPSIHPATKSPYVANAELLEVMGRLTTLPQDVEQKLRQALTAVGVELTTASTAKVTDFIPLGARDNEMVSRAGLIAQTILKGQFNLKEGLGQIRHWCENFVEKVDGDALDPDKGERKLVEFVLRDVHGRKKPLPPGWDNGLTDDDKKNLGMEISDEDVQWDFKRLKNFLVDQFKLYDAADDRRREAVDYALERMAQSAVLDAKNTDSLFKWITESSGLHYSKIGLRQSLNDLKTGELKGHDQTEIAQDLFERLKAFGEIRFHASEFWQWKGAHWEVMDNKQIMKMIALDYGHLPGARRFSDHNGILKIMESFESKPIKLRSKAGVNFSNGYLTEDLELLPHDPDLGCTYTMPYRYVPEAAASSYGFLSFLYSIWGDDDDFVEKVQALQEVMAATLFGLGPRYQMAVCLYKTASAGKSQLLEVVEGLMPPNCRSSVPPQDWGETFSPAHMYGKLLNICGELSEKRAIDGQMFKGVICGEEITAQYKHRPLFQFRPIATHWFASNYLPRTRDTSEGFNRRWLFLEFNKKIPLSQQVPDLFRKLLVEEREAITAWAVQAMPRLIEQGCYTTPASHHRVKMDLQSQNSSVHYFFNKGTNLIEEPGALVFAQKIYDAYCNWCAGIIGLRVEDQRSFEAQLRMISSEKGWKQKLVVNEIGQEKLAFEGIKIRVLKDK